MSVRFACFAPELPGRIQQQRQTRHPCRLLAVLLTVQAVLSLRAVAVTAWRRIRIEPTHELHAATSPPERMEGTSADMDRAESGESQTHELRSTSHTKSLAETDEAPLPHGDEEEVSSTTRPRRQLQSRNSKIEERKEKRGTGEGGDNDSPDEKADGTACLFCQGKCRGPTATACGHIYCWGCITRWILQQQRDQTAAACPVCR
ncbi:putative zinc finger (C3HC4 RING finger) protein [Neospora caninum Liverpool]|uniref:RING-type E3 ubiquitin transferase n=1 Tax=Neospora caninum (strain Liverpool) TaxID=572307 RepID=F0VQK7_NEOCL|nr:putative zinc finger (C3HC4 RING finger) protein [Neospora caninum Liverpool]CBZ56004.1 putative zinc finger (C3HC4 RING finger) protein [Neospora caninum Liverpool]CEL70750.1 TPA: zinc finger (C3HC4 RING finger) protein,putative [Neospora caninum Liverpool]|eukprot:XP_003886030.1 putative zinc finger (C3HC4 RING finger) protein [Neospora caninum Liverpool]